MHQSSTRSGTYRLLTTIVLLVSAIAAATASGRAQTEAATGRANATLTLKKVTQPAGGQDFLLTAVGYITSIDTSLRSPRDLDRANDGTIYVVARQANRIDVYGPDGTYLESWSERGDGEGQLWHPDDLAVYDDGTVTVYVADTENDRIQKFAADGTFLGMWGSSGKGKGQFGWPQGLAVDAAGNVYVADTNNHRVQKFDPDGNFLAEWGNEGIGPGEYSYPSGIDVAPNGDIYVADSNNHRIQVLDKNGAFVRQWGTHGDGQTQLNLPSDLTLDEAGFVLVADTYNHRVQKFTMTGRYVATWGSEGTGPDEFERPNGLMVAPGGETFVLDIDSDQIRIFQQRTVVIDDGEEKNLDLPPTDYRITEAPATNWTLVSADCDAGGPGPVDGGVDVALDASIPVTCTFTNNGSGPQVGAITGFVYHDLDQSGSNNAGDAPLANWPVQLLNAQGQQIGGQETSADGRAVFSNLAPGNYRVCALLPTGWYNLQPGNGGMIVGTGQSVCSDTTAAAGSNTRVPFGQLQEAKLILRKETNPDGASGKFAFTSALAKLSVQLGDGQSVEAKVLPGVYTVSETEGSGYTLAAISCSDGDSTGDLATATATFRAAPGETVICTFTNQLIIGDPGSLTIVAYNDRDGSGSLSDGDTPLKGWPARVRNKSGVLVAPEAPTGVNGRAIFEALPPGEYRACVLVPSGWANSDPGNYRASSEREVCRATTVVSWNNVEAYFGNWQAKYGIYLPMSLR